MTAATPYHLFEVFGIELEYMIVDAETLDVKACADELLARVGGAGETEVDLGAISWSNELALHVIEMKGTEPTSHLPDLVEPFQANVDRMNAELRSLGARLLPGGMHPWMNPHTELRLWPHENDEVYAAFDRIFDCRGHGWANLQSMHVNLPFADDDEFGRLHAAVRLLLPILPALAASSPFADGRLNPHADGRVEVYRTNARRVPSVTGVVIPERVYTRQAYERDLLGHIYTDLAELDPEGVLRHEWVNARGCIARFDRMAIEIRLLDVQECPRMDLAVAAAVVAAARALVDQRWTDGARQAVWAEHALAEILAATTLEGDAAQIPSDYATMFGLTAPSRVTAGELWQHLVEVTGIRDEASGLFRHPLDTILSRGCLARRIRAATGSSPGRDTLSVVYGDLADCLARGAAFEP